MTSFITYLADIGTPIDVLHACQKLEACTPPNPKKGCGTHEEFHITFFSHGEVWVEFLPAEQHRQLMRAAAFLEDVLADQGQSIDFTNLLLNAKTVQSPVPPSTLLHSPAKEARKRTGPYVNLNLHRLFVYWAFCQQAGDTWKDGMKEFGKTLGTLAYASLSHTITDDQTAIAALKSFMQSNRIGIVNQITPGKGELYRFMIDETLSASGIPNTGQRLCYLESGILSAFFARHYQQPIACEEERCWGLGADHCEFAITLPEGS